MGVNTVRPGRTPPGTPQKFSHTAWVSVLKRGALLERREWAFGPLCDEPMLHTPYCTHTFISFRWVGPAGHLCCFAVTHYHCGCLEPDTGTAICTAI